MRTPFAPRAAYRAAPTALAVALALVLSGHPTTLHAQVRRLQTAPRVATTAAARDTVRLSLEQALARALGESEEVRLAQAQADLARSQVTATRAQALPQLNASLSYTRTYATPFNTGGGAPTPDSLKFLPDSTASTAERLAYIEQNVDRAVLGSLGGLFGSLPLGRPNTYIAGITGSQTLYSGGRVGAALKIANDYLAAADLELQEQRATIAQQVRHAYVRATLAQQLQTIAQAALEQALRFHEQQALRLASGTASELDVMRADVDAENLRPQLVEAQNAAEIATLDLKRLVDVPLDQGLVLSTELVPPSVVDTLAEPAASDVVDDRAAVAVAERQVAISDRQVAVARGAFLPSVSLQVNYGAQNLPNTVLGFTGNPWRKDVSAGLAVQVPLFTGFRRTAELQQARIELDRSRLQLGQLRERVQLEYQQARGERLRAQASIAARQRTVGQAQRVNDLTVLRFESGLATQLEVSDARLALLRARTNLAQAIADFYIADANVDRARGRAPRVGAGSPRGNF